MDARGLYKQGVAKSLVYGVHDGVNLKVLRNGGKRSRTHDKSELHVPRALQGHNGVQNDGEQDVLRDNVPEGFMKIWNSSA